MSFDKRIGFARRAHWLVAFSLVVLALAVSPAVAHADDSSADLLRFFGRFHIVVLHLPIGILLALALIEVVALFLKPGRMDPAILLLLVLGSASAIISAALGLALAADGGYDETLLALHKWLGIAVAVLATIALWMRVGSIRAEKTARWTWAYRVTFAACLVCLVLGSHYGGSLTHGPTYLTDYAPWQAEEEDAQPLVVRPTAQPEAEAHPSKPAMAEAKTGPESGAEGDAGKPAGPLVSDKPGEAVAESKPATPVKSGEEQMAATAQPESDEAKQVETSSGIKQANMEPLPHSDGLFSQVDALFTARCYSCHGPNKAKGGLRLDTREFALEGGNSGDPTLVPGNPDESELIVRVLLPDGHRRLMPPKGNRLTDDEVRLLFDWISAGAPYGDSEPAADATSTMPADGDAKSDSPSGSAPEGSAATTTPDPKPPALDELLDATEQRVVEKLREAGVVIRPSSFGEGIAVSLSQVEETGLPETLRELAEIGHAVYELDLGRSAVTDRDMEVLHRMRGIRNLQLDNTAISDESMGLVRMLDDLVTLNLYGTQVGDEGIARLHSLKHLRQVFLWQTQVTANGAAKLRAALPAAQVNIGE